MIDGEEVVNTTELARVKSVQDMMPKMAQKNMRHT